LKKLFPFFAFFAFTWMLVGCGPRLAKGPAESMEIVPPDSLKAKFSIEVNDSEEGSQTLSGVLFAVPYKRYRMEFSGPMGVGVASVLWCDTGWTLIVSAQKKYARGKGYVLGGFAGIPRFDIHQIAGFFWGESLPRGGTIDSTENLLISDSIPVKKVYGSGTSGIPFVAVLNADGRIVEVSQGTERLEFIDYAEFGTVISPAETRVYRDGELLMTIRIKKVQTDVEWGGGTWRLPLPESYQPLTD